MLVADQLAYIVMCNADNMENTKNTTIKGDFSRLQNYGTGKQAITNTRMQDHGKNFKRK